MYVQRELPSVLASAEGTAASGDACSNACSVPFLRVLQGDSRYMYECVLAASLFSAI